MKKGQKKRKFEDILSSIDKDKFIELYNNQDVKSSDLLEFFSISDCVYRKILKLWNLPTIRVKTQTVEEVLNKYTIKELETFYKTHSGTDTKEYFGISDGVFNTIRNNFFSLKTEEEIKIANEIGRSKVDYNEISNKGKQTNLEKYGVASILSLPEIHKKSWEVAEQKYGSRENFNKYRGEQISKTYKEKPRQSNFWWNEDGSTKQSIIDNYGTLEEFHKQRLEHTWKTKEEIYGDKYYTNCDKARQTCLDKYGVDYFPVDTLSGPGRISKPNLIFGELLEKNNIQFEQEYKIMPMYYDFKINNTLIEINPTATHNILWSPYGSEHTSRIDSSYHLNKTRLAEQNGFRCIHIWDWDDVNKIILMFKSKQFIGARKCIIVNVSKEIADDYLNKNHLQNTCKGQEVRLGLYYNNELVSLMTFGKPRYNKSVEWELLRYCSTFNVIGGANKLFTYFVNTYLPKSVISYCDRSKFKGDVYIKLGFNLIRSEKPSKHWFNIRTNQHITDNLLRQRGYDQLFNTNYGKDTSNEELILSSGFLPIYDSGQDTYIYVTHNQF